MEFKDYFSLDDLHVRPSNDYLHAFTFSSLAQRTVRFQLSTTNESGSSNADPFPYTTELPEFERFEYVGNPEDVDPPPRYEYKFFSKYEISKL